MDDDKEVRPWHEQLAANESKANEDQAPGTPGQELHFGAGTSAGEVFSPSPMDPSLARAAGHGSTAGIETAIAPPSPFARVEPVRVCLESHTGRHLNTEDILRGGK